MRRFRRNPEPVYDDQYKKMIKKGGFKVKFTLKPENGEFISEIKGIEGKSCQKVVENVTNEMGIVLDAAPTEEFFQQPTEEIKAKVRIPVSNTELPVQQAKQQGPIKKLDIQKEKEKQQRRLRRRMRSNPRLLSRRLRNPMCNTCGFSICQCSKRRFRNPWAKFYRNY